MFEIIIVLVAVAGILVVAWVIASKLFGWDPLGDIAERAGEALGGVGEAVGEVLPWVSPLAAAEEARKKAGLSWLGMLSPAVAVKEKIEEIREAQVYPYRVEKKATVEVVLPTGEVVEEDVTLVGKSPDEFAEAKWREQERIQELIDQDRGTMTTMEKRVAGLVDIGFIVDPDHEGGYVDPVLGYIPSGRT